MKKLMLSIVIVLCFCATCFANFPLANDNVWLVSKKGNDTNGGRPTSYPVDLASDAFETIGKAVDDANSGDIILIWPGTYDENVDIPTDGNSVKLKGVGNRDNIRIAVTANNAVTLDNNCTLENLYIEAIGTGLVGVHFGGKTDITIINCHIYASYDGIVAGSSNRVRLVDSIIRAKFDGANMGQCKNVIVNNCIFETDGTYSTSVNAHALYSSGQAIYNNCTFRAVRSNASAEKLAAISLSLQGAIFNGCTIVTIGSGSHTGISYGAQLTSASSTAIFNGCNFYTTGLGDFYDIANLGTVIVNGCLYDTTKTSGTITQVNSGWGEKIHKHSGKY